MTGELKQAMNKATDAIGGTAGKLGANMTSSADGFVESAAIGDLYEIEAGRIALNRTRRPEIQEVARKMIADHTANTHHLQAALEMRETQRVAPPPRELDARRKSMIGHLEEAPDDAFDATYLDQQVLAHEETVTLMSTYAESGDNPQLQSLALSALPVVERHRAKVKALRASL